MTMPTLESIAALKQTVMGLIQLAFSDGHPRQSARYQLGLWLVGGNGPPKDVATNLYRIADQLAPHATWADAVKALEGMPES
jgi:hypothetical protein